MSAFANNKRGRMAIEPDQIDGTDCADRYNLSWSDVARATGAARPGVPPATLRSVEMGGGACAIPGLGLRVSWCIAMKNPARSIKVVKKLEPGSHHNLVHVAESRANL